MPRLAPLALATAGALLLLARPAAAQTENGTDATGPPAAVPCQFTSCVRPCASRAAYIPWHGRRPRVQSAAVWLCHAPAVPKGGKTRSKSSRLVLWLVGDRVKLFDCRNLPSIKQGLRGILVFTQAGFSCCLARAFSGLTLHVSSRRTVNVSLPQSLQSRKRLRQRLPALQRLTRWIRPDLLLR